MKYIYGPVKSRRLGLSLGVTLIPYKICSFNCIYCQLGGTTLLTSERKEYLKIEEASQELEAWFQQHVDAAKELHYVTLSGSGEPTLNIRIGEIIAQIKKVTNVPIAVITNSSLLSDREVRLALMRADLLVPSLDAVSVELFRKVNRPQEGLKIENIINGLLNLRNEFPGKIWLEVMLVRGINDDLRRIKRLKEVIDKIKPDKIQLNSPVRSTAEPDVFSVNKNKLGKIKEILGDKCEII